MCADTARAVAVWLAVTAGPKRNAAPLQARAPERPPADWAAASHAARARAGAAQPSGRGRARALGARLAKAAGHAVDHRAGRPVVYFADSVPPVVRRLVLQTGATLRHLANARVASAAAGALLAARCSAPLRHRLGLLFLCSFVAAAAVVDRRRGGVRTSRRHARRRADSHSHSQSLQLPSRPSAADADGAGRATRMGGSSRVAASAPLARVRARGTEGRQLMGSGGSVLQPSSDTGGPACHTAPLPSRVAAVQVWHTCKAPARRARIRRLVRSRHMVAKAHALEASCDAFKSLIFTEPSLCGHLMTTR